ncbi:MAG: CDP-alcohol phosphatidyltransferase family protein [Erythrobacter sp.]|uniref:CDP-alcohol phosphatidyltransferase family protein n=1 Tax=Erythrobacter sp. TaxID=1042 RepID=UPI00329A39E7
MVESAHDTASPDQTAPNQTGPKLTAEGRPRELEDWLNRKFYHPLSMRIAKALVPTPVTPNMVSVAGGLMIVLAAAAYGLGSGWAAALTGLGLHMAWHVFDGADGDLARLTKRSSAHGEVIDGICDYVGHIILYLTLAYMLADHIGWAAWGWAVAAGAGRIVQAAHYEVQRRQYQHWMYGTKWLRVSAKDTGKQEGIIGFFESYYVNLAKLLAPGGREVDELVEVSIETGDATHSEALRTIIAKEVNPVLRSTYLLSANYRTIALGGAMLAGSPLYFFMFEAIGLTFVLIGSIIVSGRTTRRIRHQAKSFR